MEYKNHGVLLGKRPEDYIAGTLPYIINLESGDWRSYEPTPENQYGTGSDRMNCVTQSMQNSIKMLLNEAIINKKIALVDIEWLNVNGYIDQYGKVQFSVRFNSITNGTTSQGNYLYKVGDDARKIGLIPERLLADDNSISWAEYYNPNVITAEMRAMGQEFLKRFQINYEWIDATIPELQKHLKQSPLQVVVNKGTHATAEVLQGADIWKYWDSYSPYEKTVDNSILPLSPLKYVLTFKNNTMSNVSLVSNGAELGFYLPATNPEALKAMAMNYGLAIPLEADGTVNWSELEKQIKFILVEKAKITP